MAITNREEANKYYQTINGLVDEYLLTWKIKPSNLGKYLQPGSDRFNKFLERNKLKDIKGTEIILRDIIEDRANMESDGVFTFESFKLFESKEFKIQSMKQCLYKGIEKSTLEMEKKLADHYDANLGSIDIVDSDKHIFKVEGWHVEDFNVVIYSSEELEVIKQNIIEFVYDELSKKKVSISESIEIELNEIVDYEIYSKKLEQKLDSKLLITTISDCLGVEEYRYEKSGDFHIWEM